jgi:hypothetical protein
MRPVKSISGMGGEEINENNGEDELNYDKLQ